MPSRGIVAGGTLLAAAALCVAVRGDGAQRGGDALRERFLHEAPEQWASYQAFAAHLQGTERLERIDNLTNRKLRTWEYQVKRSRAGCLLLEQWFGPDSWRGLVRAVNARYRFELLRQRPELKWALREVAMGLADKESIDARIDELVWDPVSLPNLLLPRIVKEPEFSLLNVRSESKWGDDLVRIEFDRPSPEIRNNPVRGGWALLDPRHFWVVREYEVKAAWIDGTGTVAATLAFREDEAGRPIEVRRVLRQRGLSTKTGPSDFTTTVTFDWSEGLTPDEEISLSAFGLPEPAGTTKVAPYLWFSGAGVLAIAVAAVLARLARGRAIATGS